MKTAFFPKLAWAGIRKNSKFYLPYLCTCIGMVMMFCIIQGLSTSKKLATMRSGSNIELMLNLGKYVILIFSLIFLFYTNSFLIRRRYKEFGLYNILGLDKRGISKIMVWESLFVAGISLGGGILLGVLFQKLAELALINIVRGKVTYEIPFSVKSILYTVIAYGGIFLLLFVKSVIQIRKSNPLRLLKSEKTGEKPPKSNLFIALCGVALLATAYYIAVSIQSPLKALVLFFVAVVLVILATYLLFITGSVALCKILQKNKRYYYKKNHFVSVSSMLFRMKRNGAGLASICILSTMVLVTFSSSACLYLGKEDSLNTLYRNDISASLYLDIMDDPESFDASFFESAFAEFFASKNVTPTEIFTETKSYTYGLIENDRVILNPEDNGYNVYLDDMTAFFFLTADEYEKKTGQAVTLADNQVLCCTKGIDYTKNSISFERLNLEIKGWLSQMPDMEFGESPLNNKMILIIPSLDTIAPLMEMCDEYDDPIVTRTWYYGADLGLDNEAEIDLFMDFWRAIDKATSQIEGGFGISGGSKAQQESDFYTTFGGLFFIGILLCIVFLFAAAMIIYYKQVSEGYEDQDRFEIMQKVGMTRKDIRKSINAQVLTVFFAPLLFAGLHLAFAFPMVWRILQLFSFTNLKLMILITIAAFLIFALFYAMIYKLTARAYYHIVAPRN